MLDIPIDQIQIIGRVLNDPKRPLKERFRALFTLKNIGGPFALECMNRAFADESALLKHEAAYCLGQMQNADANKLLVQVLEDKKQEAIVRHEAAEALGAIASPTMQPYLEKYANAEETCEEVRETCTLALERLKFLATQTNPWERTNPYGSIDPAPPLPLDDVPELKSILLNSSVSLFQRYRAMFTLRNVSSTIGVPLEQSRDALNALCEALSHHCDGGALFKHEVAFVLGQLQRDDSVTALIATLRDCNEHEMVRHEAAEALGAIATVECFDVLREFLADAKRVVRESCEIALDMCEYENSPEFQYANTLQMVL